MKIQLIRNELEDDSSKTGVGTYADLIEKLILDSQNDVDIVPFEVTLKSGLKNTVKVGITDPLRNTVKGRKDVDVVHVVFEYCSVFLPFTKAKRVVTFHHVVSGNERNSKKWFLTWRFSAWMSVVFSDKLIAVSSQTKEEMLSKYSIRPDKIEVITHVPEGFGILPDISKEKVIGCMGTINERKNFSAAVRVFRSVIEDPDLSDYKMIICGKGPMKDKLLEEIAEMNMTGKVEFIQDVSKEEMVAFYNRCSLLLNTSSHEGLGLATVEAQMCGTPVLFFEYAEIPKEVMEAAVSCRDEKHMAETVRSILKDKEIFDELRSKGSAFTSRLGNDFREKTLAIYKELYKR